MLFGIDMVQLLTIFCGFVVLLLLYLAYEISKLKKLEIKLAIIESRMEKEEKELVGKLSGSRKTKKKRRR